MLSKVSVCGKSNLNEVAIKVQDVRVKCVVDSGADITVLHRSLLPECFKEPAGKMDSIERSIRTGYRSRRVNPAHDLG